MKGYQSYKSAGVRQENFERSQSDEEHQDYFERQMLHSLMGKLEGIVYRESEVSPEAMAEIDELDDLLEEEVENERN